jgi:hypothetical protein
MRTRFALAAVLVLGAAATVAAHHGWSGYDSNAPLDLTGFMMFTAHATEFLDNPAFRLKLALIAAAGLNAAVFHRGVFRSVAAWDLDRPAPLPARLAAGLSLTLWVGVLSCGRLLAYF